jgi:hypothetical protein
VNAIQGELDRAFAAVAAKLGDSVTYSRPLSTGFNAIAPFSLSCFLNTSGEYASPSGPIYSGLTAKISDIPLGAQKGDLVVAEGKTYFVQIISSDAETGTALLGIRWTGK